MAYIFISVVIVLFAVHFFDKQLLLQILVVGELLWRYGGQFLKLTLGINHGQGVYFFSSVEFSQSGLEFFRRHCEQLKFF